MSQFTFVHAADLHLDTPFEGLGRVAPELAAILRDSSLAAWDALVDRRLDWCSASRLPVEDHSTLILARPTESRIC